MRLCGIRKRRKPRRHRSGGAEHAPSDLVRRDLRPGTPDHTWAGDITCIPTSQGWLHLAVVLDVGSRRLIGYSMADHTRARRRRPRHSRRNKRPPHRRRHFPLRPSPQCLSREHASAPRRHKMRHSVGRVANCWDNSVAESFFSTLKRELVSQTRYATRDQARQEISAWISRYNTRRTHSTLNHQTPTKRENHHRQRLNQTAQTTCPTNRGNLTQHRRTEGLSRGPTQHPQPYPRTNRANFFNLLPEADRATIAG